MKERPILFSAPMVRALLAGTKTQTRRVVKPQIVASMDTPRGQDDIKAGYPFVELGDGSFVPVTMLCPYGQPGDRLWVRETALLWRDANGPTHAAAFAADGYELEPGEAWTPSIHVPRKFSRIILEVTGVRVDRLQDISEQDAYQEGVKRTSHWQKDYVAAYADLWNEIHKGGAEWHTNPWVWVVEFKRVAL